MTYDYALILYFGSHESFLGAIRCQDRTTSIIILSSRNTSACCRGCRYHIPLITENDLILISCGSAADIGFSPHSRCRRPFLLRTLEVASCSGLTVLWVFSYFPFRDASHTPQRKLFGAIRLKIFLQARILQHYRMLLT